MNTIKSLPFSVLEGDNTSKCQMARLEGKTLNSLFEELEDWNDCLERHKTDFDELLP